MLGDGWIGMGHTFESARGPDRAAARAAGAESDRADEPFQFCLGGPVESRADVARWEDLGVTRLIVSPWRRSPEAVDAPANASPNASASP